MRALVFTTCFEKDKKIFLASFLFKEFVCRHTQCDCQSSLELWTNKQFLEQLLEICKETLLNSQEESVFRSLLMTRKLLLQSWTSYLTKIVITVLDKLPWTNSQNKVKYVFLWTILQHNYQNLFCGSPAGYAPSIPSISRIFLKVLIRLATHTLSFWWW